MLNSHHLSSDPRTLRIRRYCGCRRRKLCDPVAERALSAAWSNKLSIRTAPRGFNPEGRARQENR
jgi:hypothetical protein